jgi:thymidylate synthase (FAD)
MGARVILVAATVLHRENIASTPYVEHPFPSDVETVLSADELAEFAGRVRSNTWDRHDLSTATNRRYLGTLSGIELEHASATFYICGVSASAAQALAGSGLSCSVSLQRRLVLEDARCVTPPAMLNDDEIAADLSDHFERAIDLYDDLASILELKGFSREHALEAARTVLPNGTEASLLATGTMAAWRAVVARYAPLDEDGELRALAALLLRELNEVAPNTFQDLRITDLGMRAAHSIGDEVTGTAEYAPV